MKKRELVAARVGEAALTNVLVQHGLHKTDMKGTGLVISKATIENAKISWGRRRLVDRRRKS